MKIKNMFIYKIENPIRRDLNRILKRLFVRLELGKVLEIGPTYSPHKHLVPHTEYKTLDIARDSGADVIGDIKDIPWKPNTFDTIICTEVLEHIDSPQTAIREMHRVLKPTGTLILSTRFIQSLHSQPNDYYRFTSFSLEMLFSEFTDVRIIPQGNRIQLIWTMIFGGKLSILGNLMNPIIGRINWRDDLWPAGYVVSARKRLK